MNKVELEGYLKNDPKKMKKGVVRITVVVSSEYVDKKNHINHSKDYISCVAFDSIAENILKELHSDDDVYVLGKIVNSNYVSSDTGKKIYKDDIVIESYEIRNNQVTLL